MRLKGVEPSRALAHTDLNRARLPVPPQPRGAGNLLVAANRPAPGPHRSPPPPPAKMPASSPLSSRGLGRWLLMPETGVRIPVAVWPLWRAGLRGICLPALDSQRPSERLEPARIVCLQRLG